MEIKFFFKKRRVWEKRWLKEGNQAPVKALPKLLQNNGTNCLISFWKILTSYSNLTLCGKMNETQVDCYKDKFGWVNRNFIQQPEKYACPLPCTSCTFNPTLNTFHMNDTKDFLKLWVYFSTTTVEKKEEYFIYDVRDVIGSVGGTLGMFIGFSFTGVISWMFSKILKL